MTCLYSYLLLKERRALSAHRLPLGADLLLIPTRLLRALFIQRRGREDLVLQISDAVSLLRELTSKSVCSCPVTCSASSSVVLHLSLPISQSIRLGFSSTGDALRCKRRFTRVYNVLCLAQLLCHLLEVCLQLSALIPARFHLTANAPASHDPRLDQLRGRLRGPPER